MMNKLILIISLFFFLPLCAKAQTAKMAFIDWDSMRSHVDLYKINELEIARFKAYIQEIDSLKIKKFQANYHKFSEIYERASCSPVTKAIEKLKADLTDEQNKVQLFDESIPKIMGEFDSKSKEWADDFLKSKIHYYIDSQAVNITDSNKKIIELINKEENAKEVQRYFLNSLMNKIKFDYNID